MLTEEKLRRLSQKEYNALVKSARSYPAVLLLWRERKDGRIEETETLRQAVKEWKETR